MSDSYICLDEMNIDNLINFILKIDNGFFDNELKTNEQYNKIEKYRCEAMNILCKRYHSYYSKTRSKNSDLDSSYNLYLKYYI